MTQPPGSDADLSALRELLGIMARLRDPDGGCPWDRRQDFASIAPYTLEEAYEVAEAINLGDMPGLRDELGDLLFQVVFHARMAEEAGHFDFPGVARAIADKLVRRHPHVFAGSDPAEADWEALKAEERAAKGAPEAPASALDDIPRALPSLARAAKLQRRAARVGFDWDDWHGPWAKVHEEVAELGEAIEEEAEAVAIEHELGDLMFACANLARHLGVDPETATRRAGERFERRFRYVEARLAEVGARAEDCDLERLEALWGQAKGHGL